MSSAMLILKQIFDSRLATLDALLHAAKDQLGEGKATALLAARLAPDMFPLGRQVSIVGNLPRQFAQWCGGAEITVVDTDILSLPEAHAHIMQARADVAAISADDSQFDKIKHMALPGDIKFTLTGREYANDWVLPNFYFHLVTSYNILRANGVQIGKKEYMAHLMPTIMQQMMATQSE